MPKVYVYCLLSLLLVGPLAAAENEVELKQFVGHWEVIELVDDGHVIPREAIREWLPSGGHAEIADSAIMFTSPDDGKKHVKVFTIDATQYPRAIDIVTREKKEAIGIYRFDEGRLVVCLTDPADGPRPTEFAAKESSKRMLMVLKPASAPVAAPKVRPAPASQSTAGAAGVTAQVLTDAEAAKRLQGTWRYKDDAGALIVALAGNGTWSSIREAKELRLFQKVFVRTPISSGKWTVENGTLTFHCTASVYLNRVNQQLPFTIRSVSDGDFIFVDYLGRLGRASKVP